MDRIQTSNKQVDKFGVGKPGFAAGNATLGTLATLLSNTWCDGLQEEVANVIEAAGIVLSGATLNQLLLALRSTGVFQTQATNDSSTKAATTAFANPGASLSANGYQKLPSGLLIQWGTFTSSSSADVAVTFPTAFITTVPKIVLGPQITTSVNNPGYNTPTLVGFNGNSWSNTNARVVTSVSYLAIGN